jgi:hypothetical protein
MIAFCFTCKSVLGRGHSPKTVNEARTSSPESSSQLDNSL